MKRHDFHFIFSTCWGFLRASIDLCIQENMCCCQSSLAAPGVLLLRAMVTIRELDDIRLDPHWITVSPGPVGTVSYNGDFQWHVAFTYTGGYTGIPWETEWKAAPRQAGWCSYSLLLSSHWEAGFKIPPFAFLQVLQELLCRKRLEQFICSSLGTPPSILRAVPPWWTLEKWWWWRVER